MLGALPQLGSGMSFPRISRPLFLGWWAVARINSASTGENSSHLIRAIVNLMDNFSEVMFHTIELIATCVRVISDMKILSTQPSPHSQYPGERSGSWSVPDNYNMVLLSRMPFVYSSRLQSLPKFLRYRTLLILHKKNTIYSLPITEGKG